MSSYVAAEDWAWAAAVRQLITKIDLIITVSLSMAISVLIKLSDTNSALSANLGSFWEWRLRRRASEFIYVCGCCSRQRDVNTSQMWYRCPYLDGRNLLNYFFPQHIKATEWAVGSERACNRWLIVFAAQVRWSWKAMAQDKIRWSQTSATGILTVWKLWDTNLQP